MTEYLQIAALILEIVEKPLLSTEDKEALKVFVRLYVNLAKEIEDIRIFHLKIREACKDYSEISTQRV